MDLHVSCDADGDADVARDALVARAALLARDGGAPLVGVPPRVAPHCYRSTRYTRSILSSTSCFLKVSSRNCSIIIISLLNIYNTER